MSIDPEPTIRKLNTLLQKHLAAICRTENLQVSGNKAQQQQRIVEHLRRLAATNQLDKFNRLKSLVDKPELIPLPGQTPNYASYPSHSPSAHAPHLTAAQRYTNQLSTPNMNGHSGPPPSNPHRLPYATPAQIASLPFTYKPSPFFKPKFQIGPTQLCESESDVNAWRIWAKLPPVMKNHRHTVALLLRAQDHPGLDTIPKESLRLLVFCAELPDRAQKDITFPYQSELKVNGGELKNINLRGLKNKPGTTLPVDVTSHVRLTPKMYSNKIELVYALTEKRYYLSLWAVQAVKVPELVKELQVGQKITQTSVLNEMAKKASDPDIETTSTVLSLKCPISTLLCDLPVRGIACKHNQCFDAESYLQLQQQAPTWLCPICNNSTPYFNLAVDEYVQDILKKTSRSLDQVTVEPNGKWSTVPKVEETSFGNGSAIALGDDDDFVVVPQADRRSQSTSTPTYGNATFSPTAHAHGHRASSTLEIPRKPSGKRPISQVVTVDLTLSDDDDDEPPRPAQKPRLNSNYDSSSYQRPSYYDTSRHDMNGGGGYGHV